MLGWWSTFALALVFEPGSNRRVAIGHVTFPSHLRRMIATCPPDVTGSALWTPVCLLPRTDHRNAARASIEMSTRFRAFGDAIPECMSQPTTLPFAKWRRSPPSSLGLACCANMAFRTNQRIVQFTSVSIIGLLSLGWIRQPDTLLAL